MLKERVSIRTKVQETQLPSGECVYLTSKHTNEDACHYVIFTATKKKSSFSHH